MIDKPPRYVTYLLRCWEEQSRDPALPTVWRFGLEAPHTDRRRVFASLEEMVAFLRRELAGGQANQTDE